MRIFHMAMANFMQRKLKTILVALGIAIGIASMVATLSLLETMKTEMNMQMTDYGANILITADTGDITFSYGGFSIPGILYEKQLTTENLSDLQDLESRQMIRAVVPKLLGMVTTMGNEIIIAGTDIQNEFKIKPWLQIVDYLKTESETENGTDSGSAMGGEKLDLSREDYTRIELNASEVILGSAVSYSLGLFPSNTMVLNGREFTVKAVLEKNGAAEDHQLLLNLDAAQEVLGNTDEITTIEVAADYTLGSEEDLIQEIAEIMPEAKVTSLQKTQRDRNEVNGRLSVFGYAVSMVIMLAGMLVAGIGMSSSVRERTREIGVFRAIGFRKSFIRKVIFLEGILISALGGIFGFLTGTILARIMIPILTDSVEYIPWRLDVLLGSVLFALIIGALASVYPAQQVAKLDPVDAMRFI